MDTVDTRVCKPGIGYPSSLEQLAWTVANTAYHVPSADPYRTASRTLYRQAMHERIRNLFARSDEQNARLDRLSRRAG
jgi:hypothetical protein